MFMRARARCFFVGSGAFDMLSMPPATITSSAARGEHVVREDRRLHARPADLVDGGRLDRLGEAGAQRSLTRGSLAKAGREHAAHEYLFDCVGGNAGTLDRRADCCRAELGGGCSR